MPDRQRRVGRFRCAVLAAAAIVGLSPPAAGAQAVTDTVPRARSYHAIHFVYAPQGQLTETDLFVGYGRAFSLGSGDAWSLRLDGTAGVSLYGGSRDIGYLIGIHPSLTHVLSGDYLEIGVPTELFATAGTGVYAAWDMEETPGERSLIPVLAVGAGVRFRGREQRGSIALTWEERLGVWGHRLTWSLAIYLPRY